MPAHKFWLIPRLEQFKAALGAAGMAAVGFEVIGPRLVGGIVGNVLPLVAAAISAVVAWYFTEVSSREARLESDARRESSLANASHH